jgi:sugar phosphate isomerase/epimerase
MQLTMYASFTELLMRKGAREAVHFAKECGFDSVELLELAAPGTKPIFADLQSARELRRLLDEYGMKCACYSVGIHILADDLGEEGNLSGVEVLKRCADRAHILGSHYLHHTLMLGRNYSEKTSETLDRQLPCLLDRASQVARYCAGYGMTTLYEPQGYYVNGLDGFSRFYEQMKHAGLTVGVCGDVGNCLYVNGDPVEFFKRYATEMRHVHLKDLRLEDATFHRQMTAPDRLWDAIIDGRYITDTLLGEGDVDIDTCMRELRQAGYRGAYALETSYWNSLGTSLKDNLIRDRNYILAHYPDN